MPFKSQILFSLYQRLKSSPCSMSQLRLWKEANGFDVSDRTMYRYLNEMNALVAARWGEMLEVVHIKNKRKHWQISPLPSASSNSHNSTSGSNPPAFSFGHELSVSDDSSQRDLLLAAIHGQSKLAVEQGIPPSDSHLRQGEILWPLHLIQHNRCEFICLFNESSGAVQSVPVSSLPLLGFEGGRFDATSINDQVTNYFNAHFGLTDNLDEQVYTVELLIAEPRVADVMRCMWHPNQSFEMLPRGRVKMRMNCGINSELISWILSYGNQVQVIAPEILVTLVVRQFNDAINLYREPGKGLLQIAS